MWKNKLSNHRGINEVFMVTCINKYCTVGDWIR